MRTDGRGQRGATAVEYAIMVGMVALVIIAGVALFGQEVAGLFTDPGLTAAL